MLYTLAEAIFAYIDEISRGLRRGVRGRAVARDARAAGAAAAAGRGAPARAAATGRRACGARGAAGWELPERVAALAFEATRPSGVDARLTASALVARDRGVGWALVPDASAPGRRAELERALRGAAAAIGPEVTPG